MSAAAIQSSSSRLSPAAFVDMTRPHALAVARSMLGASDDVEDVVQEALIRAYTRVGALRDRGNLIAWMRQVTRTVCLNMVRQRRLTVLEPRMVELRRDEGMGVEEQVVDGCLSDQLRDLLAILPDIYAQPIAMYLLEGMPYKEIAETLGVPLGTLKGRIHRGRQMLLRGSSGRALREILGEALSAA